MPIVQTAQEIMRNAIDGAMVPPAPMVEFGIGRVAPNHFFLRTSCVPQVLLMSRNRFDSLPPDVQALIRKHSGAWFLDNYIKINDATTERVMHQLETDPRRKVVFPSPDDMRTADAIFKSIVAGYAAESPHHAALVRAAETAVAHLRAGQ